MPRQTRKWQCPAQCSQGSVTLQSNPAGYRIYTSLPETLHPLGLRVTACGSTYPKLVQRRVRLAVLHSHNVAKWADL